MRSDFELDGWTARPERLLLEREGEAVQVKPKSMEVLVALAEQGGEVVSREELLETVWGDAFVTDDVVTQAVTELRRALGDDFRQPIYIETVPRRGYRLIPRAAGPADRSRPRVVLGDVDFATPRVATGGKLVRLFGLAALVVVGLLLLGYLVIFLRRTGNVPPPDAPIQSVAVLPFENLTGDPGLDYLSAGIADILRHRLGSVPQLRVAPQGSASRSLAADLEEVAEESGVRGVVTGRVYVVGDRLVVGVELVDAARTHQVWGETYTRQRGDLVQLQSELAKDIARELRLVLEPEDRRRLTRRPTEDTEAWELYLKARQRFRAYTPEDLEEALSLARGAVARDPDFAEAHALMAETSTIMGFWNLLSHREVLQEARRSAVAAVQIEPGLGYPHAALGLANAVLDWEWEAAYRQVGRGMELSPDDPAVLTIHALLSTTLGKTEEAVRLAHRAFELDPIDPHVAGTLSWVLYQAREFDEAIELMDKTLELDPDAVFAQNFKGRALAHGGRQEEAITYERQRLAAETQQADAAKNTIGLAHALAGREEEARRIVDELPAEDVDPATWGHLGEKDRAFEQLHRMLENRMSNYLMWLPTDPTWDPLRDDPRFEEVLEQVGLGGASGAIETGVGGVSTP